MPPIITESPKSKKLALAAKVRFPCEAYGYPQPIINWLHNGNHLQSNGIIFFINKKFFNNLVI